LKPPALIDLHQLKPDKTPSTIPMHSGLNLKADFGHKGSIVGEFLE
jgi:hypothetical protein